MAGGFDSLGLMPELLRVVNEKGWLLPSDVQDETIPLILGGGDVMVAAETGSGKTAAFALPMIQMVYETLRSDEIKAKTLTKSDIKSASPVILNFNDKDGTFIIESDGLSCLSHDSKNWIGARATHGICGGKAYFEFKVTRPGLCRVGWSTKTANLELGRDSHGFGYGGTGTKSFNNTFIDYGEPYGVDDVIGSYMDYTEGKIGFTKNGQDLGIAFDVPPSLRSATLYPSLVMKSSGGVFSFQHSTCMSIPSGYLCIHSLPFSHLISSTSDSSTAKKNQRTPLAIIVEPAIDLAEQVYENIIEFSKYLTSPSLSVALVVGGGGRKVLTKQFHNAVDIVVVTPGKACEFVERNIMNLSQIRFFILDEADRLVDTENRDTIMKLFTKCPSGGTGDHRLQVCFFSATLHSPDITTLSTKICNYPVWVDLKGVDAVPETVHHVMFRVHPHINYAQRIYTKENLNKYTDNIHILPIQKDSKNIEQSQNIKMNKLLILLGIIDHFKMSQCMIFCRTNVDCNNLESFLISHGGGSKFHGRIETGKESPYSCAVLAGMRSMDERRASLEAFKEGDIRFLICTDVAARGIDIKGLPYVINMMLPDQPENYIHRIGRVGRADNMGLAISIVAADGVKEQVWWHTCKNRGIGCTNRKGVEKGGCTKWFNETELLDGVVTRLHQPIRELSETFDLPEELAKLHIIYGETKISGEQEIKIEKGGNMVVKHHVEQLKSSVDELAEMEIMAQNSFLSLKLRFRQTL